MKTIQFGIKMSPDTRTMLERATERSDARHLTGFIRRAARREAARILAEADTEGDGTD